MSRPSLLAGRASLRTPTVISVSRGWTAAEFQLVGVVFGITLGFGYFVISANLTSACITFLFASGVIDASIPYYLCVIHLCAWSMNSVSGLQSVSRIILIWSSPFHCKCLRWGIWIWAFLLTGAAFSTWIPARLQVSEQIIKLNAICYPIVRVVCLLTNACLNITFIYSVKNSLVANGLTKYNRLLRFNAKIMALSLFLDLVPILLFLLYISFFPLSTMIKLQIELVTNDLIVEVIKSENQLRIIRESHAGLIPGYHTLDGIESTISTPRSKLLESIMISKFDLILTSIIIKACMFGDEEGMKSSKHKRLTVPNHPDMWKLPSISPNLASPPSLKIGESAPAGLSIQLDDMFDSSTYFGMFMPYASPIDSESEDWVHSRMSSGYSCETDLTVDSHIALRLLK
ncbi:hypothetical protein PTTG_05504 [Puccinia triticina 1-1 BBBD Race 1]|uniref:Uncharacterized protein n=1 Tax=Puccinia triticina (isolate 1-1 / race 1 (BBBD)) TaxID=630390 RepID=A0A180GRT5_PUCT1|nr:hypothetical protein PTTG_05504 [Puccinia triticina 1-1 BBBD Race 1]